MAAGGVLAPADAAKIAKDSRGSWLVSVTKNLPLSNALDVYDMATTKEHQELAPIMLRKVALFHKTERQKLTELERNRIGTRLAKLGSLAQPQE